MRENLFPSLKTLAAAVYKPGEDVNRIVAEFADGLVRQGLRIAGVVQIGAGEQNCDCQDTHLLDLETGERLPILQDLGRHSESCRVDPAALANAGHLIARALARAPDLLFINRFGKLEAGGKGILAEIGAAALSDIPVLVGVSTRYLDRWRQFSMGYGEELACSGEALWQWWRAMPASRAARV